METYVGELAKPCNPRRRLLKRFSVCLCVYSQMMLKDVSSVAFLRNCKLKCFYYMTVRLFFAVWSAFAEDETDEHRQLGKRSWTSAVGREF